MNINSNLKLNNSLQLSVNSGSNWLMKMQKPDGEFKDCGTELCAYYKALLMFSVCGQIDPGNRCLKFIKEKLTNEKGELCSGSLKTSFPRLQRNLANYMDGWIAIGSWRLGDFTFAEQISTTLKSQQNQNHGGIATGPEKWAGRLRYDLATAASCGRAFLITGNREEAYRSADFLVEALKHQKDISNGLDLCFDEEWRALDSLDPSERTYYRLNLNSKGEKVWFPAFSCAFLCEAYQVSTKKEYLEAAKKYFNIITQILEFKDGLLANGKSGWSAGLLTLITKEEQYKKALHLIVPNVQKRQTKKGDFGPSPRSLASFQDESDNQRPSSNIPLPRRLETTAEFTAWCAEYLRFYTLGLWE